MTIDPTLKLLYEIMLGVVILLGVVAIVWFLSSFTTQRISTLASLRQLMVNYPAAVIGAIGVGNEIYQSYKYGTPFNFTGILTLFGISAGVSQLRSGQKQAVAAVQNVADSTDLVLNTMPSGPKNPVAATRTQVNPDVVPPLPHANVAPKP